jgi:hypothetical protein
VNRADAARQCIIVWPGTPNWKLCMCRRPVGGSKMEMPAQEISPMSTQPAGSASRACFADLSASSRVTHRMTRINNASIRQQRKHPRFPLDYPVQLKLRGDGELQELEAMSSNISRGGVLLQAPSPVPPNCEVEFVMTIQESKAHEPIRLKGAGRVVCLEQDLSGRGFGIAIQCKRPIHRILT